MIAPYFEGPNYAGAALYQASHSNPALYGTVNGQFLTLIRVDEPIIVDVQHHTMPFQELRAPTPEDFLESHGIHIPGSNVGIVLKKNSFLDALAVAANLKQPGMVSLLYGRTNREAVMKRLGEANMMALERLAEKLINRAFPTDHSLPTVARTFMNLTAVHELTHILNYLLQGSYNNENREEMATRLTETARAGNPYLTFFKLINAATLAKKTYAIDFVKMLDAIYDTAVARNLIPNKSAQPVEDVFDDIDARVQTLITRLDEVSDLDADTLANLSGDAFTKGFGYEPQNIDLSKFQPTASGTPGSKVDGLKGDLANPNQAHSDMLPLFLTLRWARGWRYMKAGVRNWLSSKESQPELNSGLVGKLSNEARVIEGIDSLEVVAAEPGSFAPPARYEMKNGHARIIVNAFLQEVPLDLAEAMAHELGHLDKNIEADLRPRRAADGQPFSKWTLAYWREER